ncbi:MAG: Wzz/FepE/Etk N-terminal domain-containing protein [Candidatus Zixiibacteriota bacterium]
MNSKYKENKSISDELTLFGLTRLMLKNIRLMVIFSLIVMTVVAVKVYLAPNYYISTASILPSGKVDKFSELKQLAGLGNSESDENSSELFPVILASQTICDAVLNKSYLTDSGLDESIDLQEYFGTDNPDLLRDALAGITTVYTESQNGVIRLEVESDSPVLSQALVSEYLNELENYNLNKRQSRAKENEKYLARQLVQLKAELEQLEDSLEQYQMANRNWDLTNDPEILKTIGRFKRDISVKSTTYIFLQEQYSVAKLDVQKDIPIVRLLDKPSLPTMKSGPRRKLSILLSGVAAFLFIALFAIAREAVSKKYLTNETESLIALRDDITGAFPRSTRIFKMVRKRSESILKREKSSVNR